MGTVKTKYTFSWFHHFMIGSLLKYKRLQEHHLARRKSIVQFRSFLMGTHLEIGRESPVQKLRGSTKVLKKIQNLVVSPRVKRKLQCEPRVIAACLELVHERNRYIIPGLLNPESIPTEEHDGFLNLVPKLLSKAGNPFLQARNALSSYGACWKMSPAYHKFLSNWENTGRISDKPWHQPMEGFFQAAIDTDPSKGYGDCSEFSLLCYKTGTSIHTCQHVGQQISEDDSVPALVKM